NRGQFGFGQNVDEALILQRGDHPIDAAAAMGEAAIEVVDRGAALDRRAPGVEAGPAGARQVGNDGAAGGVRAGDAGDGGRGGGGGAAGHDAEGDGAVVVHVLPIDAELLLDGARNLGDADMQVDLVGRVELHLVDELLGVRHVTRRELP